MTNEATVLGENLSTPEEAVADQAVASEAPQEENAQESYLDLLVGEGKKFSNAELLARAKLDSDLHIKKLEEENKALRAKDTNYDLILAELEKKQQPVVAKQDPAAHAEVKIDPASIDKLIDDRLSEREKAIIHKQNLKATWEALTANYGNPDTAKAVVAEFIKTKPYMKGVIDQLGQTNPQAALTEILNFKSPASIGNKSVNPLGTIPSAPLQADEVVTWSEANKIRKTDLKKYASATFQTIVQKSIEHYQKQGLDYYKS